jgi:hypothetical protein
LLLAGSALLPAQAVLTVEGGSYPGTIRLGFGPLPIGKPIAVLYSLNAGPTPLAWIDPADPRLLQVGLDYIASPLLGVAGISGHWSLGPIPVGNDPALLDFALFVHGFSYPGAPRAVDQVPEHRVLRFAPANAFRDRRTGFQYARAFFPVIPLPECRWMIAGGGSNGLLSQVALRSTEIYDPRTDSFTLGPLMTTERSLHKATRLPNGRWLLTAGVDVRNDPQNVCELFDPATNQFTATAPMRDKRMGHTATLLPNGKVLVTGGLADMNAPNTPIDPVLSALHSTELYDPATGLWTVGPNMGKPRAGHEAVLLPNGKVLLAGGIGWNLILIVVKVPAIFAECDLYDPATNTISPAASMAKPRAIFPVADLGNARYLASGGVSDLLSLGQPTTAAEVYDASANQWNTVGSMAQARGMHAMLALGGGRFLAIGGADGQVTAPNALDSTEVYSDTTRAWSAGPRMSMSRAGYGWFEAPTGQLHLLGGGSGTGSPVNNFTDWYYR